MLLDRQGRSKVLIECKDCYLYTDCNKYKQGRCDLSAVFCQKLFRINSLLDLSELPPKLRYKIRIMGNGIDDEKFDRLATINSDIVNWVNNGGNLYIYSPITGNGKTSWSIKLLQSYINKIWFNVPISCQALFINVPRYFNELKNSFSYNTSSYIDNVTKNITSCDLVIWDDIGTKTTTEFEAENLLSIIDTRLNNNKANIFTSNRTPDNLGEVLKDRLTSRIIGNSELIKFEGLDKRGKEDIHR